MASVAEICNRALQKLGAKRITSIDENSNSARACLACYDTLRDSELQKHRWGFAVKRAELAADATAPAWGRTAQYTLPADFLKLIAPYPEMDSNSRDWVIENRKILTNDSSPIYIRYIAQITDPNQMDVNFREGLSAKMAMEMCEELTQSNSKKESAREDYKTAIKDARKSSAIQNVPQESVEDSWITIRNQGSSNTNV